MNNIPLPPLSPSSSSFESSDFLVFGGCHFVAFVELFGLFGLAIPFALVF